MTVATAAAARTRPAGTPPAAARRRPAPAALHVVPASPWRAPLAPFILVSVAVVVAGLLGLLLLNTLVAQDSFRVHQLEGESTVLRERAQTLGTEVAKLEAPGVLARRAEALGLVPANTPGFLRLVDGRVAGDPKAALAPPPATAPTPAPAVSTSGPVAGPAAPAQPAAPAAARKSAAHGPAATKPAMQQPVAQKMPTRPGAQQRVGKRPPAKR